MDFALGSASFPSLRFSIGSPLSFARGLQQMKKAFKYCNSKVTKILVLYFPFALGQILQEVWNTGMIRPSNSQPDVIQCSSWHYVVLQNTSSPQINFFSSVFSILF